MGAQFLYARLPHLDIIPVSFSSSGNNIVVPGTANKRIQIHRLWIMFGGNVDIVFKSGSTSLSGTLSMVTGGTFTLDISGEPWFPCGIGEDFIINLSDSISVNGMVYYMAAHR